MFSMSNKFALKPAWKTKTNAYHYVTFTMFKNPPVSSISFNPATGTSFKFFIGVF